MTAVGTLYRHARFLADPPGTPAGTAGDAALLVVDDRIAWIGPDAEAAGRFPDGPKPRPGSDPATHRAAPVDLGGALVLPGFVDGHVHVTETGLLLDGLDLSGARSVTELLDLVRSACRARPGRPVLGHGWDELALAEGRAPTIAELDRAGGGGEVYLSRVDVHSAVVSGALAERAGLRALTGWDPTGRVERDAHHAARHVTRFAIDPAARRPLHLKALRAAAAAGVTEVHEMSAPHVAPEQDLAELWALTHPGDAGAGTVGAGGEVLPRVVPYRGELAGDEGEVRAIVARLAAVGVPRVAGLAGDLMVDGSFGSRTAALRADYADAPGHRGHLYLDAEQIRDHVVACTRAGLRAGFHVIGDAGTDAVLTGFAAAAAVLGAGALRAAGHRVEHLESVSGDDAALVAGLGLTASVQPAFDAAWGGPDGMYAVRLGAERALRLNPLATLASAGVRLVLGSDSPVTPLAPWAGVRAAMLHRTPSERLDLVTALAAHTPGWQPAVGAPATFSAWHSPALDAVAAGGPLVPALAEGLTGGDLPRCVLTLVGGGTAFQSD